jgi:D-methionine transport system substrate-binding protein
MKLILKLSLFAIFLLLTLTACREEAPKDSTLKIGTISGPETDLMETAKMVAKQQHNLDIFVVPFGNYAIPNAALSDGTIDANIFQHQPYLQASIKAKHYDLTAIAKTFLYPMGLYSLSIDSLKDLPNKATVAIPNDPTNEARALLLLQKAGFIELRKNAGIMAKLSDIIDNPKQLKIIELNAAQLPRALQDVSLAAMNTTYTAAVGLTPSKDALFLEGKDSPYTNLIVIRTKDKDDPRLQQLIAAVHSPEVVEKAKQLFKGDAIPAWD